MSALICIFVMLTAVLAMGYHRLSALVWSPIFGGILLALSLLLPSWILVPAWLIWAGVSSVFLFPVLRQRLFMTRVFKLFKHLLPPISQTEQEALDAGNVWWEGDLFQGKPDWNKLLVLPKPSLTEKEQAFIDNQVNTLCQMLNDWDIVTRHKDLPPDVWAYIKKEGFLGLVIEEGYGGHGFSALAHSTIVSRIASCSLSAAVNVMVPNSLGPGELIYHYGTEQQKNYYLPRLAKGLEIPCFGLTGTYAGSDAGAIPDTGIIGYGDYQGKTVLGMRLNFDKRYITLAPVATLIGIAFKLYDPEHLLGDKEALGITLALVPSDTPGVEKGARHLPMGLAFMNGPVRGKDVFLPLDFIIGGEKQIGQGWRMLVECLSIGRSISLPALSTAVGAVSFRTTGAYARIRKQFKLPIAQFEGVEEGLARIAGYTYQLEAARVLTVSAVDLGVRPSVVSAIAKYHMSELSRQVMNDALDIHAGKGIQMGPTNYLAHGYYGIPVSITVEGANILTRNLMIFGQGAMRCHPYIRQEIVAVNEADSVKGYATFDALLCQHMGYTISQLCRGIVHNLTRGYFIASPKETALGTYYRQLTQMSTRLAVVADLAMICLGGDLKRKERLSARLGDVLSQLYLGSAVLKYAHDQGETEDELPYAKWCLEQALYEMRKAFEGFFDNFSFRPLARLLKGLLFLGDGRHRTPPKDSFDQALMPSLLTLTPLRQRLVATAVVGETETAPMHIVERAFREVLATQDLEKALHKGLKSKGLSVQQDREAMLSIALETGILTKADVARLRLSDQAVAKALRVDEFNDEQLTGNLSSWLKQVETIRDNA